MAQLLTAHDLPQAAVLPVDWKQFVASTPGANQWSSLKHCVFREPASPLVDNSAEVAAQNVRDATPNQRVDLISYYLLKRIAQTLKVPATDLDELAKPGDLGVDSLNAVEVQIWVKTDLNVELGVEQLFTTSSIKDLAISIDQFCLLYTSPSPRDRTRSRMPSSA